MSGVARYEVSTTSETSAHHAEDGSSAPDGTVDGAELVSAKTNAAIQRLYRDFITHPATVDSFVSEFLFMLDGRLESIGQFLTADDSSGASVAILSLASTSEMIGVDEVVELLSLTKKAVKAEQFDEARALFEQVLVAAELGRQQLSSQGFSACSAHRPAAE
jgi:hypothetical protein